MTKQIKDPIDLPSELPLEHGGNYLLPSDAKQALRFAWASGRPLLVLGEPGIGKTDLARAFAKASNAKLYEFSMKSTSSAQDLLWAIDHVDRLAAAQVMGQNVSETERKSVLDINNFLSKGVLWKALSNDARDAFDIGSPAIVLIDEIDKAAHDVPNNLLDVLDTKSFALPNGKTFARQANDPNYMVIITSNKDKVLPAAFLRRCAVLTLKVDGNQFEDWLVDRAKAHFDTQDDKHIAVFRAAASLIKTQREQATKYQPGTSEYLDLLRAARKLETSPANQEALLAEFVGFIRKDVAA